SLGLADQEDAESRAKYDSLEEEFVPLSDTRDTDGLPRGWPKMMKGSISSCCPIFNTNRMVEEYVEKCYWPSAQRFAMLSADNLRKAHQLAQWRRRLAQAWQAGGVEAGEARGPRPPTAGPPPGRCAPRPLCPPTPPGRHAPPLH